MILDTSQGPQSVGEGSLFLIDLQNFRDSHLTNSISPIGGMVVALDQHSGSISIVVLALDSSRCSGFLFDFEKKQSLLQIREDRYYSSIECGSLEINSKLLQGLLLNSNARDGEETVGVAAGLPVYLVSTTTSFDRFGNYAAILPERIKNVESWPFIGFHLWLRQGLKMTSDDLYDIKRLIKYKGRLEILSKFRIESIMKMRSALLKLKAEKKPTRRSEKVRMVHPGDEMCIQYDVVHAGEEVYVQDIKAVLCDTVLSSKIYASMGLFYTQYAPRQIFQLLNINSTHCGVHTVGGYIEIVLPSDPGIFIPEYGIVCIDAEPRFITVKHTPANRSTLYDIERTGDVKKHDISLVSSEEGLGIFTAYRYHDIAIATLVRSLSDEFLAAAQNVKDAINRISIDEGHAGRLRYMNTHSAITALIRIGLDPRSSSVNPPMQAQDNTTEGIIQIPPITTAFGTGSTNPDSASNIFFRDEDDREPSRVEPTGYYSDHLVAAPVLNFSEAIRRKRDMDDWNYRLRDRLLRGLPLNPEPERVTNEMIEREADDLRMTDEERRRLLEISLQELPRSEEDPEDPEHLHMTNAEKHKFKLLAEALGEVEIRKSEEQSDEAPEDPVEEIDEEYN